MKYVNNMQAQDFEAVFVKQKGSRECWFACSLMLRNLRIPGFQAEYDLQKTAFYTTQAYKMFSAFYHSAGIALPDPMQAGAGADLLCAYLNELLASVTQGYFMRNLPTAEEKFKAIQASIDLERPVIIGYRNYHYMIVIGYDETQKRIAYLDPEQNFYISSRKIEDMEINELILDL